MRLRTWPTTVKRHGAHCDAISYAGPGSRIGHHLAGSGQALARCDGGISESSRLDSEHHDGLVRAVDLSHLARNDRHRVGSGHPGGVCYEHRVGLWEDADGGDPAVGIVAQHPSLRSHRTDRSVDLGGKPPASPASSRLIASTTPGPYDRDQKLAIAVPEVCKSYARHGQEYGMNTRAGEQFRASSAQR